MTLSTDYILGLIITVGADAYHCMPSLKVEDGEAVKYPEIAYAIASTCDALCKEIAGLKMGETSHDSRELVVGIIQRPLRLRSTMRRETRSSTSRPSRPSCATCASARLR